MAKKNRHFHMRVTEDFLDRVKAFAEAQDKDAAEYVRDALNEKMERDSKRFPELKQKFQQHILAA